METTTYTLTEADIREAIVEWLARQNAGDGPGVSPDALRLQSREVGRTLWANNEVRATVEVGG